MNWKALSSKCLIVFFLVKIDCSSQICSDFIAEPDRSPLLIPLSVNPYNGETQLEFLTDTFLTPNELFYIRNNFAVPNITTVSYSLSIEGIGLRPLTLTYLQILTLFPPKTITAVLQCAGNRRAEMNAYKNVSGTLWGGGAIGNARWTGASLKEILNSAGFNLRNYRNPHLYHVQFEGSDCDPRNSSNFFGASIPLSYLLDPNFEPLVAYGMNGQTLPRDHGFPIRIILPGIVGARNVKWLKKIVISDRESNSSFQKKKYKMYPSSVGKANLTHEIIKETPPILELPVTSFVTTHRTGDIVRRGVVLMKGYAYSGGGRRIIRVEVSTDFGVSWELGTITIKGPQNQTKDWSWVHWEKAVPLLPGRREVWVKAVDNGYNQQPQEVGSVWNVEGYLNNAYSKITLIVS